MDTSSHKPEWKQELLHRRDELIQLKDEIRVRLHLAGMDAKDTWHKLQPRIEQFERTAEEVTEDVGVDLKHLGEDLKRQLLKLRDELRPS